MVQPIEPPSPTGWERGQAARRGIDFYPATVIPAQAGIYFSATEVFRTIQKKLISSMDSRLRGNDGDGCLVWFVYNKRSNETKFSVSDDLVYSIYAGLG